MRVVLTIHTVVVFLFDINNAVGMGSNFVISRFMFCFTDFSRRHKVLVTLKMSDTLLDDIIRLLYLYRERDEKFWHNTVSSGTVYAGKHTDKIIFQYYIHVRPCRIDLP